MFVKAPLLRVVNDSCRLINRPTRVFNLAVSERKRAGTLTWGFTRCFSKDINKPLKGGTADDDNVSKDNDDGIEMFDVEEEKKKFYTSSDLSSKYKLFKDEDSPVILDVEEERLVSQSANEINIAQRNEFEGISSKRGVHGVFDVEELVSILKSKSAEDIVVIEIDSTAGFAQQMVIVSGKSHRHLLAIASFIRRAYKKRVDKSKVIPRIEGKKRQSEDWFALDLGNIVLHLFSKQARTVYDLESLWALGPEFDPCLNQSQDPLAAIISKHSHYLSDLQPADSK